MQLFIEPSLSFRWAFVSSVLIIFKISYAESAYPDFLKLFLAYTLRYLNFDLLYKKIKWCVYRMQIIETFETILNIL